MLKAIKHAAKVVGATVREWNKSRTRSPLWHKVRDQFLKEHPKCAVCGSEKRLQVHHIEPFHLHPELELLLTNLITLCMDKPECHFRIGHGGDWDGFNPNVINDAKTVRAHPEYRVATEVKAKQECRPSKPG